MLTAPPGGMAAGDAWEKSTGRIFGLLQSTTLGLHSSTAIWAGPSDRASIASRQSHDPPRNAQSSPTCDLSPLSANRYDFDDCNRKQHSKANVNYATLTEYCSCHGCDRSIRDPNPSVRGRPRG